MKNILRTATYVYISLKVVLSFAKFFDFGTDIKTFFLFCLLLTLLFMFKRSILEMLSLPYRGIGYWLISFIMTLIVVNIFSLFFNVFSINSVTTPDLIIFGFMIPSVGLSKLWSGVLAALLLSAIINYFDWLGRKK
jgi:hypothetical protein